MQDFFLSDQGFCSKIWMGWRKKEEEEEDGLLKQLPFLGHYIKINRRRERRDFLNSYPSSSNIWITIRSIYGDGINLGVIHLYFTNKGVKG